MDPAFPIFAYATLVIVLALFGCLSRKDGRFPYGRRRGTVRIEHVIKHDRTTTHRAKPSGSADSGDWRTSLYKELYFKTQSLEFFPEILPKARQTLFALLSEGLEIERGRPRERSILNIETYSREALQKFISAEQNSVTDEWERYVERRARGGAPELFHDRQSAVEWLKQHAPSKYVDGAWLGHIHKITTPYALRGVTKDAWQVLSEELGDGDLEKNHAFLYAELLKEVGVSLPDGCDADFIHPRHGLTNDMIWKGGTTQLLISMFPHEFLPEILGFNMHFELLTMQTLQASRELPELGVSGYYFTLHVSIDNADSGHTAMALGTVSRYLDLVQQEDPAKVQEVWTRIQAGYILSKVGGERLPLSDREQRLVDMLRLKADASHQIHCASRVKIGHQTLAQWLSPGNWTDTEGCKRDFLQGLANAKPWVSRGNSGRSLLMRELSWKGRMFGAFTNAEVEDLQAWIDQLDTAESDFEHRYWSAVQRLRTSHATDTSTSACQDVAIHYPVYLPQTPPVFVCRSFEPASAAYDWTSLPRMAPLNMTDASVDAVLSLWFVHPCLLENMVSTPYRAATLLASHVLRVLRAESGFLEEGPGVAGIDEQLQSHNSPSLISLGLEMMRRLGRPLPARLKDVLGDNSHRSPLAVSFSRTLLALSMRPIEHDVLLLGFALAFLDFEDSVAAKDGLLSTQSQEALRRIVARKRAAFNDCLGALEASKVGLRACLQHYVSGRRQIEEVLQ